MIILLGKTASGKDRVCNELITKYGYKKLVTYTNRHMREGEEQDKTYHFISTQKFEMLISSGFFAEYTSYNVASGETWYYGSALEDYKNSDDKTIVILNPEGFKQIQKFNLETVV